MAMPPTFVTDKHRTTSSKLTLTHGIFVLLVLLLVGSFLHQAFSPVDRQEQSRSAVGVFLDAMANVPDRR
jgi:hypothetical protein